MIGYETNWPLFTPPSPWRWIYAGDDWRFCAYDTPEDAINRGTFYTEGNVILRMELREPELVSAEEDNRPLYSASQWGKVTKIYSPLEFLALCDPSKITRLGWSHLVWEDINILEYEECYILPHVADALLETHPHYKHLIEESL